jgi:predicted phosphodiesterase
MKRIELDGPFAVFSDVHGNLPALEAVLDDVERRGVGRTLCLGDLVGYGPWPNEVALAIRDRGIPCLMGNYDQGIGFEMGECGCIYKTDEQRAEGAASLAWTEQAVTDEVKAFLRSLEDHFLLATPAAELLAVHGSPRRINEYLFEDRPASAMERMAHDFPYKAIIFGHTHLPYARPVGETVFVNVGSAGRPKDGDWRACYAIVDSAALGRGEPFVEFVRVAYDHERLLAGLAETSLITCFAGPGSTWEAARA